MKKYGAFLKTFAVLSVILFIPIFCAFFLIYSLYTDSIKESRYSAIQNTLSANAVNIEQKLSAVDSVSSQLVTTLSRKLPLMRTTPSSDPKTLITMLYRCKPSTSIHAKALRKK